MAEAWGYAYGHDKAVVWADVDDKDVIGLMVMVEGFLMRAEEDSPGEASDPANEGGSDQSNRPDSENAPIRLVA